jgi:hypothetical protein
MSDSVKGAKGLKGSVRSNGHAASGGHVSGGKLIHQNNSALSRANRTQWDWSNPPSGPQEPYKHHEYPKHVHCDPSRPKHYVVVHSAEEEARVRGGE